MLVGVVLRGSCLLGVVARIFLGGGLLVESILGLWFVLLGFGRGKILGRRVCLGLLCWQACFGFVRLCFCFGLGLFVRTGCWFLLVGLFGFLLVRGFLLVVFFGKGLLLRGCF